jgi:mutator protein MutT
LIATKPDAILAPRSAGHDGGVALREDMVSDEIGGPLRLGHPPGEVRQAPTRVAAAVVWRDGRLLLTQRPPGGPLGLQWELPGGKLEPGESAQQALVREIREELGVRATPHETLGASTHEYPHGLEVALMFVHCTLDSHDFAPSAEVHDLRWMAPADIDLGTVLEADRAFLRRLATGKPLMNQEEPGP